jgi:hypothetical protein
MLRDVLTFGFSFPAGTLIMILGLAVPGGGWVAAPLALGTNGAFVAWLAHRLFHKDESVAADSSDRPI